jgi:hypothetical protein
MAAVRWFAAMSVNNSTTIASMEIDTSNRSAANIASYRLLFVTRLWVRHQIAEGRSLVTVTLALRKTPVAPTDSGTPDARLVVEDADPRRSKSAHTLQRRETAILRHLMTGQKLTCDAGLTGTAWIGRNTLQRKWLCVTQE